MPLEGVQGFVFDVDGTLVHRDGPAVHVIPGAIEVLERITASGRPYAFFTNGSHGAPSAIAQELRAVGVPVEDRELLTPLCSVQAYLKRLPGRPAVSAFATEAARAYLTSVGVRLVDPADNGRVDAVFVAHTNEATLDELERAARAVIAGARLLTGSYVPAYAGANGPILSRGAMITAAIAKASGARPIVVGKPSRSAVREMTERLGVPSRALAVVGDDVRLDIALGRLGGSTSILVRSGISSDTELASLPAGQRPDLTLATVAGMLEWL